MALPAVPLLRLSLRTVLLCGGLVRLCLLVWGEWQDHHMAVPYTDIDYGVFSDGALLQAKGASPYERATYRYSPVVSGNQPNSSRRTLSEDAADVSSPLSARCSSAASCCVVLCGCVVSAWLLFPVVWLPWFGKLLFSACDCVLAALLHSLLCLRGVPSAVSLWCVCVQLFNPLSLAVSTRGNGDVLHLCVLYAMLLCMARHRGLLAAVCFGVAVHLRLYPVVFLPTLLLSLDSHYCTGGGQCQCGLDGPEWLQRPLIALTSAASFVCRPLPSALLCAPSAAATRHRVLFAVVSGATFCALFALCFALYGRPFVTESVTHHIGRVDTRHNFSLLFYPAYLTAQQQQSHSPATAAIASLASFVPQLLLSAVCAVRLSSDVWLCLLLQTAVFVSWNKVVTAQYFAWYVGLLPLVLPFSRLPSAALLALSASWLLAELHWLSWAYRVELLGLPAFAGLHAASCAFFLTCALCMAVLIVGHRSQPLFKRGRLTQYHEQQ